MGKVLTLLLTILLALASAGGFLFYGARIADGERRIAEAERQLQEGRAALRAGETRLDAGERELEAAKEGAALIEGLPFVQEVDELLGGAGSTEVDRRLAEGDEQVAGGEQRIATGRQRIAAGELAVRRGRERLRTARRIQVAFAVGAAVLALLTIGLGLRWRGSLTRTADGTDG